MKDDDYKNTKAGAARNACSAGAFRAKLRREARRTGKSTLVFALAGERMIAVKFGRNWRVRFVPDDDTDDK